MQTVTLPNLRWYGNEPRSIYFPDDWDVEVLEPPGFGRQEMSIEEIESALESPIGSKPIGELAADASEVCIIFDDLTRPTPVGDVLPSVLRDIREAGIPRENVRLIPALGMHGAMNNIEFRKKLGDDVVREYAIFNHNPYENCEDLGKSPSGIPVFVNREFMSCDLKVGIGCITPHLNVGFGGGGKIVLPGICGLETITAFHDEVMKRDPQSIGLGKFDGNVMYEEIKDVVRMSGLDFKVDGLINARGEIADLFAGDPLEAHRAGTSEAKEHYGTVPSPDKDIVVVNAYAKYNEMGICMLMALVTASFEGATIVITVDAPEGQVCHYLLRSFGKEYGGRLYLKRGAPPEHLRVIVCSKYPDMTMCDLFAPAASVEVTGDWDETLSLLRDQNPGSASVAVIPDGTMQYFVS